MNNLAVSRFFYVCGAILLVAILPIESFTFYMLLRYVLFSGFIIALIKTSDIDDWTVLLTFFGAFLWNPFFINEMDKSIWIIYDVLAAALFFYWGNKLKGLYDEEVSEKRAHEDRIRERLKTDPDFRKKEEARQAHIEERIKQKDKALNKQTADEPPKIVGGIAILIIMVALFLFLSNRGWTPYILGLLVLIGLFLPNDRKS